MRPLATSSLLSRSRIFAGGLLSIAIVTLVIASHWDAKAAEAGGEAKSSIWKVTSDTCTIYLAGSVHLLREEDYPLPPVYDDVYADSKRLVFEIDLAESADLGAALKMAKMGMLPADETIKDRVSEETYELLQEYFESRGIGGPIFEKMKPGMLTITIASLEYIRMGARPDLGVDMVFYKKAAKDGKPVDGLETTEFQMGLFDQLSDEKQEVLLRQTLEELEKIGESADDLLVAWKTGDVKALKKMVNEQIMEDEELGELLLLKRNRSWIEPIEKMLAGAENVMVVVGAGHLVGPGSVTKLLAKRGYEIEQLTYPAPAEKAGELVPAGN